MTHALVSGAIGGVGPKGAGGMAREEEPRREVALAHRLTSVAISVNFRDINFIKFIKKKCSLLLSGAIKRKTAQE